MKGRGSFKLRVGDVKIYGGKVEICMWYFWIQRKHKIDRNAILHVLQVCGGWATTESSKKLSYGKKRVCESRQTSVEYLTKGWIMTGMCGVIDEVVREGENWNQGTGGKYGVLQGEKMRGQSPVVYG